MDFIVEASPTLRLLHTDLAGQGRVLREWNSKWATDRNPLPSGDGRYLAFEQQGVESNAWILENF